MLVLRTRTWQPCRYALFTLPTEQFHQFCAAWSRDSFYIMAGAAGAQVRACSLCVAALLGHLGGRGPSQVAVAQCANQPQALACAPAAGRSELSLVCLLAHVISASRQVWVYHVGSGKVVAKLQGFHKVNVRDLDYDPERNLLVTGSFDKSVAVVEHRPR